MKYNVKVWRGVLVLLVGLMRGATGFSQTVDNWGFYGGVLEYNGGHDIGVPQILFTVRKESTQEVMGSTLSDADGDYLVLINATVGEVYSLVPSKPGHTFSPSGVTLTFQGQPPSKENFTATRITLVVTGNVRTMSGVPVPGLMIDVSPVNGEFGAPSFSPITDEFGRYQILMPAGYLYRFQPLSTFYAFWPLYYVILFGGEGGAVDFLAILPEVPRGGTGGSGGNDPMPPKGNGQPRYLGTQSLPR